MEQIYLFFFKEKFDRRKKQSAIPEKLTFSGEDEREKKKKNQLIDQKCLLSLVYFAFHIKLKHEQR